MKTMLTKELRENWRWAALAGFGLLFAEVGALISASHSWFTAISSLCAEPYLVRSAAGCAAIGTLLAILQIVRERGRDRWAQLLHRPAAPGALFAGKIVAGLLLAFVATVIPFLASVAYAAWPAHFPAPFVPGLMIPSGSDLLLAPLFYLATAALSLHSGPGWGARSAMLFALAGVTWQHVDGNEPFLLPLGSALLFGLVAWGAFRGGSARAPRVARLALGAIVLSGTYAALHVLTTAGEWAPGLFGAATRLPFVTYEIASDGSFFLRRDADGYAEHAILMDLAGNQVTEERYLGRNPQVPFLGMSFLAYRPMDDLAGPTSVRSAWRYMEPYQTPQFEADLWYLLPPPRNYFVAYDRLSHRRTQICDAEGFKGPDAIPHPFGLEPQGNAHYGSVYFWSIQHRLWALDLPRRKATPFMDLPNEEFYGAMRTFENHGPAATVVALASGVRFYDADGNLKLTLPYQHEPRLWRELAGFVTADRSRYYLRYSPSYLEMLRGLGGTVYLDEYDGAGHLLSSHSTSAQPELAGRPPVKGRFRFLRSMPLLERFPPLLDDDSGPGDRTGGIMVAVVLAVAAWCWGSFAGLAHGRRFAWVGSALAFGLPGLLAYRLAARWSPQVACPVCARPRLLEQMNCSRCGAPWRASVPEPTSIFEPVASV